MVNFEKPTPHCHLYITPTKKHLAHKELSAFLLLVHPARFERATPRFEAWCSIQLSYGCMLFILLILQILVHLPSHNFSMLDTL